MPADDAFHVTVIEPLVPLDEFSVNVGFETLAHVDVKTALPFISPQRTSKLPDVIDWSITNVFRPATPGALSQRLTELGVTAEIVLPRALTVYTVLEIVAAVPEANAEQAVVAEVI